MANERLTNGPEGGPDYTETNGAAWMPGFTCGGRSPKVEEGEEVVEPFGPEGPFGNSGHPHPLFFNSLSFCLSE